MGVALWSKPGPRKSSADNKVVNNIHLIKENKAKAEHFGNSTEFRVPSAECTKPDPHPNVTKTGVRTGESNAQAEIYGVQLIWHLKMVMRFAHD